MYGYLLRCLAEVVKKRHGLDTWLQICEQSGVDVVAGHILVHRQYSEAHSQALINTSATVLGISLDDLLEETGVHFLDYLKSTGYERFLRALGITLHDFLANLDLVYLHLDPFYPDMSVPLFRCSPASEGGLLLQYTSHREGLGAFVVGIVKSVAHDFFHLDVQMDPVPSLDCTGSPQEIQGGKLQSFVIKDKKALCLGNKKRSFSFISNFSKLRISSNPKDSAVSTQTFCRIFPYHFMLNRDLGLVQAGDMMSKLIQLQTINTVSPLKFADIFVIQKPLVSFTFSSVLSNMNTLFSLKLKQTDTTTQAHPQNNGDDTLCFRGQAVYIPESDCILFMCSPRAHDIADLKFLNITLVDLPQHDVTRQLFLVSQCRRQGRELVRKLEETSCDLLKMQEKLQQERKQTDRLLFSMLPEHIAHELRIHRKIKAERFDVVTVLCSDIVNFTALCGHENVVPMDIIRVLNKLYTQFDALTSIHGIFKVETIGDAYLLVGGVPEYSRDHADRVIAMAFDMIEVCKTVISPADGQPIKIRLGVHSGECVAGVVGRKKPRYCLFGQTVSLASQMEALSLPNRINITAEARRFLVNTSTLEFEINTKESPFDTFLISRRRELSSSNIALGLPAPRGMFKTPNPTPPSSHDSSPATSPLWIDRVPTSFSCDRTDMGPTLTVPSLRVAQSLPSRNQTNFSFDIKQPTLNFPQTSVSKHAPTVGSCIGQELKDSSDQEYQEYNNNISIHVEVPRCHAQSLGDECSENHTKSSQKTASISSYSLQKLPLDRTKYFEPVVSDRPKPYVTNKNGLLRRNSDIPKSLVDKDAKLVYYFRPSQSNPPTPHNS